MNNQNLISNCCHEPILEGREDIFCCKCLNICDILDTSDPDNLTKEQLAESKESDREYFENLNEFNSNLLPIQ